MSQRVHPNDALFDEEKPFPVIPSCEHFAGSEKLILKALELQEKMGPVFDITCDCEDGAAAGKEAEHAEMVARVISSDANKFGKMGVRIHDYTHPHWKADVDILIPKIKKNNPKGDIKKEVVGEVVGFNKEESSEAVNLVCNLTGDNEKNTMSFGTEAGLFQNSGISTVICGPGSIKQAHTVDEYITFDQLKKCLKMLAAG